MTWPVAPVTAKSARRAYLKGWPNAYIAVGVATRMVIQRATCAGSPSRVSTALEAKGSLVSQAMPRSRTRGS